MTYCVAGDLEWSHLFASIWQMVFDDGKMYANASEASVLTGS